MYKTLLLWLVFMTIFAIVVRKLKNIFSKEKIKEQESVDFEEKKIKVLDNAFANAKQIKICTECGSKDIHVDFSQHVVFAAGTPVEYKCNSCGKTGYIFPEIPEEEVEEFRKELKKKK